jgi:hypothetical protein
LLVACNINIINANFLYNAMEIGYFLQNSSNGMKIYTIKFKLIKFKFGIPQIIH